MAHEDAVCTGNPENDGVGVGFARRCDICYEADQVLVHDAIPLGS